MAALQGRGHLDLHHFQKHVMKTRIIRQLRMKGRQQNAIFPHEDRSAVIGSEYFDTGADTRDERGTDEDGLEWRARKARRG